MEIGWRRILTCASLVGALAAASAVMPVGSANADAKRVIKVVRSVDTEDQTQHIAFEALQKHADAINKSRNDISVQFWETDAQGQVAKQIADVEAIIQRKPDVMIFSAVDTKGSIPAVKAAHDVGIKIIDVRDLGRPDLVDVVFHGSDEPTYAKKTNEWIKKYLQDHPDVVLKVGLVYGAPAQIPQLLREDTVKALAKEMPSKIQIVAEAYGNWNTETTQNIVEDWLKAHPEINYISCANDIMALGASNALIAADKKDQVLVSGYDATPEGVKRIQDGKMDLTVGVLLGDYGYAMDVAVSLAMGTFKDHEYTVPITYAVDKQNVTDFLKTRMEKEGH